MKSIITYRVQSPNWLSDHHFEKTFDQLKRYKDQIDEVAIFTGYTHSPLTIEEMTKMANKAKERIPILKEMGFKVGFNYQVCLGHNRENLKYSLQGDYEKCMNPEGVQSTNLCPRGKNVEKYLRESLRLMAEAHPDFIWIDDDLRMWGHATGFPDYICFCPNCMKAFGEYVGVSDMSIDKFNELTKGENPDKLKYREAWMLFCRDSIGIVLQYGREECDKVDKNIIFGYMHADAIPSNSDFEYFGKIMAGERDLPVKFRPGGGYYDDYNKNGLIGKALYLGRQISNIPEKYWDVQSELENFPYFQIMKSAYANVLESVIYIAAGCTGVTFNTHHQESFGSEYSTVEENEIRFSKVLPARPFFDEMVETFGREPNRGLFFDFDTTTFKSMNYKKGKWLYGEMKHIEPDLYSIGFSPAFKKEWGNIYYAYDENFASLSDEEIKDILKGGVYCNGKAVDYLRERGFGEYVGFKTLGETSDHCHEKFLESDFNKGFRGYRRECRHGFWLQNSFGFEKTDERAVYLAKLEDFGLNPVLIEGREAYSMGVFENSLGGRVCVSGYDPDTFLKCYPKTCQLKRVFSWLSKDCMNYIESYANVHFFDRGVGGFVFNNSYDEAEEMVLALSGDIDSVERVDPNMTKTKIKRLSFDGKYSRFDLGFMKPFGFLLVKYNK
ncbi:MAG: hypothetical protein IJS60_02585 [Abditibacteriota bacterium]|nr:hypothetical protein [Abditibacteriota bacterium]